MAQLQPLPEKAKILVCINDSEHSKVALKFACYKANRVNCPIQLLHILEPTDSQAFLAVDDVMRKEKRQEAEKLMQEFSDYVHEWTKTIPEIILREGMVGEEIANTIEEDTNISMLVIGTSPDSPSRGKLLPWLSTAIGDRLLIPMLIIPGNLTDQQIEALT